MGLVLQARGIVCTVPDLARTAPFETPPQRDLDVALDRPAEERPGRLVRPADSDTAGVRRQTCPFGLAEDDDGAGLDDRELLPRDRLARVAEHVCVVEADVRQQ